MMVRRGPHLRAIQERIFKAAVARVEQLGETERARGDVGRDEDRAFAVRLALLDPEISLPARGLPFPRHRLDLGQRRGPLGQFVEKSVEDRRFPFDLDPHASRLVLDGAAHLEPTGERIHERAETRPPARRPGSRSHAVPCIQV